ncbi:hypothetical protein [Paraburkholderia piptadeniae]|nr:hypothetical protein [Paraburkholderia piptadeniae]
MLTASIVAKNNAWRRSEARYKRDGRARGWRGNVTVGLREASG